MISIIIPFYNTSPYIERCLQSVISQTYQDFEIILVDDGSTDDCVFKAENFLQKMQFTQYQIYCNKENKGQSTSRNIGMKLAKGKYIFFLDADDEFAKSDSLQKLMEKADLQYDFIYGIQQHSYEGSIFETLPFHKLYPPKKMKLQGDEIFNALLNKKITISPCNIIYNKQFLEKHHLKFEEGFFYEDELWMFQVCYFATKAILLDEITYNYFQGNLQSTTKNFTPKHSDSIKVIMGKMISFCEKENVYQKIDIKKVARYIALLCKWFLMDVRLHEDEKTWKSVYKSFKKNYEKTKMHEVKKHFLWSPTLSYYILTKKLNLPKSQKPNLYQRFINRINFI